MDRLGRGTRQPPPVPITPEEEARARRAKAAADRRRAKALADRNGEPANVLVFSAHTGGNESIFQQIVSLYVPRSSVAAAVTCGEGVFWRNVPDDWYVLLGTDIQTGTDCRDLPYDDGEIGCVVLDPPYMHTPGGTAHAIHTAFEKHYRNTRLRPFTRAARIRRRRVGRVGVRSRKSCADDAVLTELRHALRLPGTEALSGGAGHRAHAPEDHAETGARRSDETGEESEFPRIAPAMTERRNRCVYSVGALSGESVGWRVRQVAKRDHEAGTSGTFDYGPGFLAEEHVFVPRRVPCNEDDGWLVGASLDYGRGLTGLAFFDARRTADGRLARAWLDDLLPLAPHRHFSPA